jgi:pyrroloquinoline quinone (PQQ) biosynthesis protein C
VEPKHAAPEPASDVEPEVKRPARAASVDMWRSYAVALGIDPKGLSKQEIIAATR